MRPTPDRGPHAEGGGGHAVQARRPDDRPQPAMGAGQPPPAAPHGPRRPAPSRSTAGRYPLQRHALPDDRPGRSLRAVGRGTGVHGPALRRSFLASQKLWEHMQYLRRPGAMCLRARRLLIFHGCVPVRRRGEFLPMDVDGKPWPGRALFDAIDRRSLLAMLAERRPTARSDRDLLWYLWCGAALAAVRQGQDRHPGERPHRRRGHAQGDEEPLLRADPRGGSATGSWREFGVDPERGLIVNGHVPVKIEKGESPIKRSGKAITIDGAFSEAYGDHGYTLVLEPDRIAAGRAPHFESVEAAVRDGEDIIPKVTTSAPGTGPAAWPHRARRPDPLRDRPTRAADRGLPRCTICPSVPRRGEACLRPPGGYVKPVYARHNA